MEIDELLKITIENKASDLHLTAGDTPMIRIDGDLHRLDMPVFESEQIKRLVTPLMTELQYEKFKCDLAVDFGYSFGEISRFRINAFHQHRGLSAAFRAIPLQIPTLESLEMTDPILKKVCGYSNGLVLFTGPTGTGKSTSLAAIINYINEESNSRLHILTIEDPIEYIFHSKDCLIQQREIGKDAITFDDALRSALREDPDVILVGEMRDLETIRLALTAAETGHLVFATLHTSNASKSIYRIVDAFPSGEKDLIRAMLSESLRAVVAQILLKRPEGGRIAAQEIMLCIPAIRNLIRENKISQLYSAIQTGKAHGMRTLAQHIEQLVIANKVLPPKGMRVDYIDF